MPIATNRERLSPNPPPRVPPWRTLTTRGLADWLGVTLQTAYNWHVRRSGPPRSMSRSRRASYRWADVAHWLEGEASPSADHRIRAFLAQHMRLAMCATGLMQGEAGAGVRRALARLDEMSGAELEAVCAALDRVFARERLTWPKAAAVGTGEVRAHG